MCQAALHFLPAGLSPEAQLQGIPQGGAFSTEPERNSRHRPGHEGHTLPFGRTPPAYLASSAVVSPWEGRLVPLAPVSNGKFPSVSRRCSATRVLSDRAMVEGSLPRGILGHGTPVASQLVLVGHQTLKPHLTARVQLASPLNPRSTSPAFPPQSPHPSSPTAIAVGSQ
jgi:hypothetical protein